MIKFFRNIRQNLLAEGKTTNYLKYAIGEIVLVVIGILIALQINNWNETRKHQIAEREFLEGIKNDLRDDKTFIELVLNKIQPKIKAYNQLNLEVQQNYIEDKKKIDSLLGTYLFVGQRTFYPISGSFQSAVAGNEINTYKNKELIRSIIKLYHSTYPRLIENGQILDERWAHVSEKYSRQRRLGNFEQMNSSEFFQILDNFHYHFVQLRWYQNTLNNSIKEIDNIIGKSEH